MVNLQLSAEIEPVVVISLRKSLFRYGADIEVNATVGNNIVTLFKIRNDGKYVIEKHDKDTCELLRNSGFLVTNGGCLVQGDCNV